MLWVDKTLQQARCESQRDVAHLTGRISEVNDNASFLITQMGERCVPLETEVLKLKSVYESGNAIYTEQADWSAASAAHSSGLGPRSSRLSRHSVRHFL